MSSRFIPKYILLKHANKKLRKLDKDQIKQLFISLVKEEDFHGYGFSTFFEYVNAKFLGNENYMKLAEEKIKKDASFFPYLDHKVYDDNSFIALVKEVATVSLRAVFRNKDIASRILKYKKATKEILLSNVLDLIYVLRHDRDEVDRIESIKGCYEELLREDPQKLLDLVSQDVKNSKIETMVTLSSETITFRRLEREQEHAINRIKSDYDKLVQSKFSNSEFKQVNHMVSEIIAEDQDRVLR